MVEAFSIQAYLKHLAQERRLSPRTVDAYRRDLTAWAAFCADRRPGGEVGEAALIRAFVAEGHRRGLSGRSLRRRLAALRGYFRYRIRENTLDHNPAQAVRAPKGPRRLPRAPDVDQTARLLTPTPEDDLELRDLAILELFYSSGLRLAELVGLRLADLDLADASVRVLGKGAKTRVVPVGAQARAVLERWLRVRPRLAGDTQALFVGRGGRSLSHRAVQQRLARWARKHGAEGRLHPHALRHAFASHLLESSGDLRAVQELLGHADIGTTQVYTHLDFQHLARIYDAAHPRARKNR